MKNINTSNLFYRTHEYFFHVITKNKLNELYRRAEDKTILEKTINDILSVPIDSNEDKFYNLAAANTLTIGPNNEVSINASQSTIPGTLNTSASYALYALTASYAINGGSGGGGGSTDTGSLLKTASFSNPNISFTKGDGTTFKIGRAHV